MTNTGPPLIKTCSSCGQQKPISAFLEAAGPDGTTYGNICADCRKAQAEKVEAPKEEESSRSNTGHKIDIKAKVAGDIDKQQERVKIEKDYYEEREISEQEQSQQLEKKASTLHEEKKHRQSYLDRRPFLSTNKKMDTQRAAETNKIIEKNTQQAFKQEETVKQERAVKEEKVKTGIDLTAPYTPSQTGEIKHQSAVFSTFKAWLGASAPIVKTVEQAQKAKQQQEQKNGKSAEKTPETPSEYIEKTWGPGSKRGR